MLLIQAKSLQTLVTSQEHEILVLRKLLNKYKKNLLTNKEKVDTLQNTIKRLTNEIEQETHQ